MGERRRQLMREFRVEAVRLLEESDGRSAQVAREFGVHEGLLKRSKAQLEGRSRAEAFPGNGKLSAAEEEIRRLRRALDQAKQETAFLENAAAYFARESR